MIRLHAAGLDAARWLSLGAAPVFALMALLSATLGAGRTTRSARRATARRR